MTTTCRNDRELTFAIAAARWAESRRDGASFDSTDEEDETMSVLRRETRDLGGSSLDDDVDAKVRDRRSALIDARYSGRATAGQLVELSYLNAWVAERDRGKLDVARLRAEIVALTSRHVASKKAREAAFKEFTVHMDWRRYLKAVDVIERVDLARLEGLYTLRAWHRGRIHAHVRGRDGSRVTTCYDAQAHEVAALRREFAKAPGSP